MRVTHPIYGDIHAREDGTIPCTNACGKDVCWSDVRQWWIHTNGDVGCGIEPWEGQEACPEPPGDDDEFPGALWGWK